MERKWTREELFEGFLDFIEFSLVKYEPGTFEGEWGLIDHTGANLGGIESDRFNNAFGILNRLDVYEYDYIVTSLIECLEKIGVEVEYDYWEDLLKYRDRLPDNAWDFSVLEMICDMDIGYKIDLEKVYHETIKEG